jgi:hypothetical protein
MMVGAVARRGELAACDGQAGGASAMDTIASPSEAGGEQPNHCAQGDEGSQIGLSGCLIGYAKLWSMGYLTTRCTVANYHRGRGKPPNGASPCMDEDGMVRAAGRLYFGAVDASN